MTTSVWEFLISGFRHKLYNQPASWNGFTFEMLDDWAGQLRFDESIDANNQLASSTIEEKVDEFVRSLRFKYQWNLSWRITARPSPAEESRSHIDLISTVAISSWLSAEVSPGQPPPEMPAMHYEKERFVRTFVEAANFDEYVEEQLRRYFLIMEELWSQKEPSWRRDALINEGDYDEILKVRNFVSHAVCHDKNVVQFISANLPSAIIAESTRGAVRFERTVEHRNFVSRYSSRAQDIARKLIESA